MLWNYSDVCILMDLKGLLLWPVFHVTTLHYFVLRRIIKCLNFDHRGAENINNIFQGFKGEWMTVKDHVLYVGGFGKPWTTPTGI